MALDMLSMALSQGYTDEIVIGGGALKGKNCVVSNIEEVADGVNVTFQWTLDNGTVQTETVLLPKGTQGEAGVAGKSAYEIWLEAGNTGTEEDFLNSLKGEKGADGTMTFADLTEEQKESLKGADGQDGIDGVSPLVEIVPTATGNTINITDKEGLKSFEVVNGIDGQNGNDGADGFSPIVTVTDIEGGHNVAIEDVNGVQNFEVLDGKDCDVQIDDVNDPSETSVWSSQKTSDEIAKVDTELKGNIEELSSNLVPKKIKLQNVDERVTIQDNGSFIINGFAFVNLLVTFNETIPQWNSFVRLPRPKGYDIPVNCENSVRLTIYSQDKLPGDCGTTENVASGTELRVLVNYEVA